MISVQNLSKQYGEQVLFRDASFSIGDRERVGLVGRNGHGKSTLFRILTGQEPYDGGQIIAPRNYRIGFLTQHIHFTKETVLEEGCLGLTEEQIHDEWRVEKILSGLGFTEEDFFRSPHEFSGGYQIRINLAKVLVSEPNLLLLDEPTNFLDILSIRWLTGFLKAWPNEMVIICHDRGFMDAVTTHTLAIHRAAVRKIKGPTAAWYEKIVEEEELYERQRLNEDKKREEAEQFISRFRAKATKAKQVQSRVKALEKMGEKEKLENIATLAFSFRHAPFPAKTILEAKQLTFGYGGGAPLLIRDLSFTVGREDKICIVGKNGKGKTTLLKMLAGELKPLSGDVREHGEAKKAYFEQSHTVDLSGEKTVEEEILSHHPEGDRRVARSICGAMMFTGDLALKKIRVLSGGEKCRVLLGNLLVNPSNLLLLDEPSNHLDMESTDALTDAAVAFQGAVVMITHNEEILHRLATKLIVFHEEEAYFFDGTYAEFLEQIGWGDELLRSKTDGEGKKGRPKLNKKELRKAKADLSARRSARLGPLKERMEKLEGEILKLEAQSGEANGALAAASGRGNGAEIARLSKEASGIQGRLDAAYGELGEVTSAYDEQKAVFDKEETGLMEGEC